MLGLSRFKTSALSVAVFLAALFLRLPCAQADCGDLSIIVRIAFNESDADPDFNDPEYVKIIIYSKSDDATVTITEDNSVAGQSIAFTDKFTAGYSFRLQGYYVRMIGAIDRDGPTGRVEDDVNILQYTIECSEGANSVFGVLRILITDVNDNPPVFNNPHVSFPVTELTSPPSVVYQEVSAYDIDEGQNGSVEYFLSPMPGAMFNGSGLFHIEKYVGDIYIDRPVDFESMYESVAGDESQVRYEFIIFAVDQGYPAQSSTSLLTIFITDADDQSPTFDYPSCNRNGLACLNAEYDSYILSNDTLGSDLTFFPVPRGQDGEEVEILAHDLDTLNASLECEIGRVSPIQLQSYFDVWTSQVENTNRYSCNVYHFPDKPISREEHPSVRLLLQVKEQNFNGRSEVAELNIEVLENPTVSVTFPWTSPTSTPGQTGDYLRISPSTAVGYVMEDAGLGSFVYVDENFMTRLEFTFSYANTNRLISSTDFQIAQDPASPFIVSQWGFVQVSDTTLDFETKRAYKFTVVITEQPTRLTTATAYVTIFVVDVNDNSPVFDSSTDYEISVEPDDYTVSEMSIFTFTATDADGSDDNNQITFQLMSVFPSDGMGKFSLDSSGELFVDGHVFDGDSYEVEVAATDNGFPIRRSGTAVLTVNIVETVSESDGGLGTGALVGIAVAAILVIALAIILIACFVRKRRRDKGNNGNTPNVRKAKGGGQELRNVAATNPVSNPKDQAYVYADGFIHDNTNKPKTGFSRYDNTNPQQDDEEIYDRIDDSGDGYVDVTATQANSGVPDNSYVELVDVPRGDDSAELTPALPRRPQSKDYYSHPEPIDSNLANAKDPASAYAYVNPAEADINAGKDSMGNTSLQPVANAQYTGIDSNNDSVATEATEDTNGIKGRSLKPTEGETSKSQNAADNENDSKNCYDTLVPDDPNYTNLNSDPREYFKVNKLDG